MYFFTTLCLATLILIFIPVVKGSSHSLGFLFVYSELSQYNSTEAVNGVEEAIEDVEYEDIVPGYKLEIIDLKYNKSSGIKEILKYITNPILSQPLIAIISGGYSLPIDALIDIAEYQNIPLISYTPDTVKQSMNYYQLYPSDEPVIQTLVTVIKFYGWSRISIITEVENKFLKIEYQLKQSLAVHNISVLNTVHVWSYENVSDIKDLFVSDARIIFLNTFIETSRNVLCEAYIRGIYYPDYGWLFHGWYNEDWLLSDPSVHCNTQQLTKVVERGIVVQQYTEEDERSSISSYGYDAVWSLGVALNSTLNMINDNTVNESNCIGPFSPLYNRSSGTDCLLRHNLLNIEFTGKSGDVAFTTNGIRTLGTIYILQHRNYSLIKYATINITSNHIVYLSNEDNSTVWPVGLPPDGSPIQVKVARTTVLVVIMYLWASLGIIFAIICLIFNVVFRKRRIVRLTSPNLNYFIITGVILLYTSTFFHLGITDNETFWNFSCAAIPWAQIVGIALVFGPVLAKLMRIHYIFNNPTSKKKILTDKHLLIIVVIIESIMILLLTIGTAIPQTRPSVYYDKDKEYPPEKNEKGILVEYYGINCFTTISFIWAVILIIYIGILEVIAVILAIKIRNVTIKAVNDSKDVIDTVFIVSMSYVATLVFLYFLGDYNNIGDGFMVTSLMLGATGTIILTFVPKMWSLYKDPDGDNVFEDYNIQKPQIDKEDQDEVHRNKTFASIDSN